MFDRTTQEAGTSDQQEQTTGEETAKPKGTKKKGGKTAQLKGPSDKGMKSLALKAKKIYECDVGIRNSQKESMLKALLAGELLLSGKQELKRLGIRRSFKEWIELEAIISPIRCN